MICSIKTTGDAQKRACRGFLVAPIYASLLGNIVFFIKVQHNVGIRNKHKVWVGLSGGVDSAASALLLLQQGYQVRGVFMKNWEEDDTETHCSSAADLADARAVCDTLQIPLQCVNFSFEYWEQVFEHCLKEYQIGRTPNPDILCNQAIKFHAFLNYALQNNADFIATGHYARKQYCDQNWQLMRGTDPNKDQSYFLYTLTQQALARTLFPVGDLPKPQVRAYAKQAGLPNHDKKDSTGICFIGERRFKPFLSRYIANTPGLIKSTDGTVLGQHDGLSYYTLGQRQGLGIGGRADGNGAPWFVAEKNNTNNELIVAQGRDHPSLYTRSLLTRPAHWIGPPPMSRSLLTAKIRYRQQDTPCTLTIQQDQTLQVHFSDPQWSVTPGQSIVLYQGLRCLGGAVIEQRL